MPKSFSMTDIGSVREMNQDCIFSSDEKVGNIDDLYVVADGMGGQQAGEYASRYTVDRLVSYVRKSQESDPKTILDKALQYVNREVRLVAATDEKYNGMGTTVVAAVITGDRLLVANVGDSRLYVLSDTMHQITEDHSLVQEMIDAGSIDRSMARFHPDKNVITRAVGAEDELDIDFFTVKLTGSEVIIMCTDGLTNMVDDGRIRDIVRENGDPEQAVKALVAEANRNGGVDNISVILIVPSEAGRC